jgi:type 1 glutamine amidotransferase
MNIARIIFSLLVVSFGALNAASNWKPSFDDKPVAGHWLDGIEAALPQEPIVQPAAARKILVFSATAGYRHGSIAVGKVALARLGESTGAYSTVISDDPANFEAEMLKTFDAVVLLSPTLDFFMPEEKLRGNFEPAEWAWLQERHNRLVDNLINYVKDGGGLMGIHSPTDACYGHEEYGEMIGGYFDGHPWMWNTDVTIVVEDPEHSTMKPVFGRVFYTSIGHNDHIYTNPLMLKHYLAGIQFAIGDLIGDMTPSAQLDR